jgi:hypothetical protein
MVIVLCVEVVSTTNGQRLLVKAVMALRNSADAGFITDFFRRMSVGRTAFP